MLKHVERTEQAPERIPEDVMRLHTALHRLYEHAIRRGLEAEAEQALEPGQSETAGLVAGQPAASEKEGGHVGRPISLR